MDIYLKNISGISEYTQRNVMNRRDKNK